MPRVTPIPTTYAGLTFRSRIEARWAHFFDELKVEWHYEREGYQIGPYRYLPDFYLPEVRVHGAFAATWIEIKPSLPVAQHFPEWRAVAEETGASFLVGIDSPIRRQLHQVAIDGRPEWMESMRFAACNECHLVSIQFGVKPHKCDQCSRGVAAVECDRINHALIKSKMKTWWKTPA